MRVDVVSIFPAMFDAIAGAGITSRALQRGLWQLERWNPRDFATTPYQNIDDRPYGGGPGMVMQAPPLTAALGAIAAHRAGEFAAPQSSSARPNGPVILMSPQGQPVSHAIVQELAQCGAITIIAGRYEGVDQRFIDCHVTHEYCVGDFVVSGGELPAMMLMDAVIRLLPGAVNDPESVRTESFATGMLDYPQFTRPERLESGNVPAVLLSGDHARIDAWRRCQALRLTARRRPDLIDRLRASGGLSGQDEAWLADQDCPG